MRCQEIHGTSKPACVVQHDAERVPHARFPDKTFHQSAICKSAHAASVGGGGGGLVRYGWMFEYV